jgi:hypothetical protein
MGGRAGGSVQNPSWSPSGIQGVPTHEAIGVPTRDLVSDWSQLKLPNHLLFASHESC